MRELDTNNHSVFAMYYHLVLVIKYRRKVINEDICVFMLKAYKFRLYPNKEQQEYFAKCFGCARFIYNQMLADKIEYYKKTGEMLNNTPAQYKKEYPWFKEVDSLALANAQMNLNKAYMNFFRDKSVGFPKFKSKKRN